jgi:hypothetical protein
MLVQLSYYKINQRPNLHPLMFEVAFARLALHYMFLPAGNKSLNLNVLYSRRTPWATACSTPGSASCCWRGTPRSLPSTGTPTL